MSKIVLKLFWVSIILLLCSCAPKHVEMPSYEGVDVKEVLSSRNNIMAIETRFSITFEKEDTEIRGDAALNLSKNGDLSMRIYSFGFLAFEMTSENGIIRSNPSIDRNKGTLLTYGLRDCLFWWDIKDFETEEKDNTLILANLSRKVWIDRKTMLPLRQTITLEDGRELNITYENPEKSGDFWYPSKIRIELLRSAVTLKIKDLSFVFDV